jgi:GMP synthase (glutamine-hydrolysing)
MACRRPSAIALRHVAFEDLGLLGPILARMGWKISYREAPIDDLTEALIEQADLLIALGGPIGVYETTAYPFLNAEIAILERRLARGGPTLGICLGSQLMAKALGARVFLGAVKEIGWGPVTLTRAGPHHLLVFSSRSARGSCIGTAIRSSYPTGRFGSPPMPTTSTRRSPSAALR